MKEGALSSVTVYPPSDIIVGNARN